MTPSGLGSIEDRCFYRTKEDPMRMVMYGVMWMMRMKLCTCAYGHRIPSAPIEEPYESTCAYGHRIPSAPVEEPYERIVRNKVRILFGLEMYRGNTTWRKLCGSMKCRKRDYAQDLGKKRYRYT
jgi:hypothetical protein